MQVTCRSGPAITANFYIEAIFMWPWNTFFSQSTSNYSGKFMVLYPSVDALRLVDEEFISLFRKVLTKFCF